MGKKKIPIEFIEDSRRRKLCFDKRQQGLLKKAMELCKLARTEVGLIIISEEQNSLVEFWSGEKTGLVQRYQELAATPHYDFTLDDYESEISNALALRPFPSASNTAAAIPSPGCVPQAYYNNCNEGNRPLKRPRYTLEEDSSSCYSSQPPSPIQLDEPTSAPSANPSLDFSSMDKPLQQLNGIQESLGKLCESFNTDRSQLPTLSSIGANNNNIIPSVLPLSTPSSSVQQQQTNNTPVTAASVSVPVPDGTTTPMIADSFDATSIIGDVDFSGLLSYIGKTDTVPALPSPQCPNTPNFAGSTVWEVPTLGGDSFV